MEHDDRILTLVKPDDFAGFVFCDDVTWGTSYFSIR